jgi:hypothetical protein
LGHFEGEALLQYYLSEIEGVLDMLRVQVWVALHCPIYRSIKFYSVDKLSSSSFPPVFALHSGLLLNFKLRTDLGPLAGR